jgi:hypothetical protein
MARIHIFSGLGSSLLPSLRKDTLALDKMIDAVSDKFDSEHHIWNDWQAVARQILTDASQGRIGSPIILIGHSNGVLAACCIAQALGVLRIPVDYIGAIDPTAASFPALGMNVKLADDFQAARGWPAFTRRMSGGKRAALVKGRGFSGELNVYPIGGGHIEAPGNNFVVTTIMSRIAHLTRAAA